MSYENDGLTCGMYCSNQHHRFQNFIDSAYLLAERTQTKMELLVVEWNPPGDRRRVLDSFVSISLCIWDTRWLTSFCRDSADHNT